MLACKLLLIGDSLIAGFGLRSFDVPHSNHGVNSDTTKGVIARMHNTPVCENTVIHIGINEIGYTSQARLAGASERTSKIVDYFYKKGSKVYILAVPASCKWSKNVDLLNTLNARIKRSGLIAVPPGLKKQLIKDCVHLKRKGYKIWSKEINRILGF